MSEKSFNDQVKQLSLSISQIFYALVNHPVLCVFSTLGDVQYIRRCSVHQGDIMSTLGDVQYIEVYHDECGGYHEYLRGCSVHWRDTMSTSGDIMSTTGDIMSTTGDV